MSKTYQVVHVIKPSGTAFEFRFGEGDSPEAILKELARNKQHFGYNQNKPGLDPNFKEKGRDQPTELPDPSSGFCWDHPDTCVKIIGTADDSYVFTAYPEPKVIRGVAREVASV